MVEKINQSNHGMIRQTPMLLEDWGFDMIAIMHHVLNWLTTWDRLHGHGRPRGR
jgi:hypothetical protein